MDRRQIREALKKKGVGKLDGFLIKTASKKELQSDLMNVLQTWTHCLLYHKNIYPPSAFTKRQILQIPVYVALSPPLKQYLDCFFSKLKPSLNSINYIQIVILSLSNEIIQVNTIHIDNVVDQFTDSIPNHQQSEVIEPNKILKQVQFKKFLNELPSIQKQGYIRKQQQVTFKIRVGYRYNSQNKNSKDILQGWLVKDKLLVNGSIAGSLISPCLNLIHQISY